MKRLKLGQIVSSPNEVKHIVTDMDRTEGRCPLYNVNHGKESFEISLSVSNPGLSCLCVLIYEEVRKWKPPRLF